MLYLYRRESKDSAGHGEYRGGGGMDSCFIPHNTNAIQTVVAGNGGVTPNTRGISSYPGAPIRSRTVDDSDILERFENQEIPEDIENVDGEEQIYPPKAELLQEPTDVMETRSPGTAGYGDPLNRDPEKVLQDIKDEIISLESANDIYGVVFDGDGDDMTVDEQATEQRREELIETRLEESTIPAEE
jgi:N-methylhydantoinase B